MKKMSASFSTKKSCVTTSLVRLTKSLCLFLLLALPPIISVAQDDFSASQDTLVSLELSPLFVSNFMFDTMLETQAALANSFAVTAEGSSALAAADGPSPAAVPLTDAAWLFGAGLIGFVLLSNRRSA